MQVSIIQIHNLPQRIASFNMRGKLTAEDALDIFRVKESMISASNLSKKYGVTEKAVRDIWTGRTWLRETSCLDASRSLQPKKMGRPLGRKDAKPRKQRIARLPHPSHETTDSFSLYRSEAGSNLQALHSLEEKAECSILMSLCNFNAASAVKSAAAIDHIVVKRDESIDDMLFRWDLWSKIDRGFQDPFGQDWLIQQQGDEKQEPGVQTRLQRTASLQLPP